MYERLLLPTDGSDVASAAGEAAVALADRFGADLHVLAVRERDGDATADEASCEATANAAVERAAAAGVDATPAVVDGELPVAGLVLEYAADHGVDCVVVGTHGRTGLSRFVLGSVAEEVLRASPVPVVTVHGGTRLDGSFERVVVPTDGSEAATAGLDHAVGLALATGATLRVVSVVDTTIPRGDVDPGVVLEALETAAEAALDRAVERAEGAGVSSVERAVLRDVPYRAIVTDAADRDADCIVMGTHGRTGMDRALLGSVTERVVRLADAPVVGVPGRGAGEASDGE
jgi:nucleotide-binding universal stress UspA family protein